MTAETGRLLVRLATDLGTARALLRHLNAYTNHRRQCLITMGECDCGLTALTSQVRELLDRGDPTLADKVLMEAERARAVGIIERMEPDAVVLNRLRTAVLGKEGS